MTGMFGVLYVISLIAARWAGSAGYRVDPSG